jgi:hypothetical protein
MNMKKKSLFLGMLAMTFALVVAGCDDGSTDTPDSGDKAVVFTAAMLQARPSPASGTGKPIVLASRSDGTSNYYLIDVGYISEMYISTIATVDYTGVPLDFTKTITNTATYTNSLTNTVSNSIAISTTLGVKTSIGAEVGAKLGVANFAVKTNLETSLSATISQTTTKSTTDTATTATQYAESQTIKYQFGTNDHPAGRYRYAMYGVCDVYFIIKTSLDNQTLQGWETSVCARQTDYFVRSEYAANGVFTNEPTGTIDFAEDFWKDLEIPNTSANWLTLSQRIDFNVGNSLTVPTSGDTWYRTDYRLISLDLAALKEMGYTKVSFEWKTYWAEEDNGYDCTAHVVLDHADINLNHDGNYYDHEVNPGNGWKWVTWIFDHPIDTVKARPNVRCAYGYTKRDWWLWTSAFYKLSGTVSLIVTAVK